MLTRPPPTGEDASVAQDVIRYAAHESPFRGAESCTVTSGWLSSTPTTDFVAEDGFCYTTAPTARGANIRERLHFIRTGHWPSDIVSPSLDGSGEAVPVEARATVSSAPGARGHDQSESRAGDCHDDGIKKNRPGVPAESSDCSKRVKLVRSKSASWVSTDNLFETVAHQDESGRSGEVRRSFDDTDEGQGRWPIRPYSKHARHLLASKSESSLFALLVSDSEDQDSLIVTTPPPRAARGNSFPPRNLPTVGQQSRDQDSLAKAKTDTQPTRGASTVSVESSQLTAENASGSEDEAMSKLSQDSMEADAALRQMLETILNTKRLADGTSSELTTSTLGVCDEGPLLSRCASVASITSFLSQSPYASDVEKPEVSDSPSPSPSTAHYPRRLPGDDEPDSDSDRPIPQRRFFRQAGDDDESDSDSNRPIPQRRLSRPCISAAADMQPGCTRAKIRAEG